MATPKTHGGKRKGAGRKPAAGTVRQVTLGITVTPEQKAWLKSSAGGASATVRGLIDAAMRKESQP